MAEIKRPDQWIICKNKDHWKDILIWNICETCKKTIQVHESDCECWDCNNEREKQESDAYDLATHPLS